METNTPFYKTGWWWLFSKSVCYVHEAALLYLQVFQLAEMFVYNWALASVLYLFICCIPVAAQLCIAENFIWVLNIEGFCQIHTYSNDISHITRLKMWFCTDYFVAVKFWELPPAQLMALLPASPLTRSKSDSTLNFDRNRRRWPCSARICKNNPPVY